jgi:GT2 family glycosyltransferase
MKVRTIGVCVVNFNGHAVLGRCLDAVASLSGRGDGAVLVVDDASTDASGAIAEDHPTHPRLVRLAANRGPGAARNAGVAALACDRILFIDNDIVVDPTCLEALSEALDEHPNAVAAMPRVCPARDPNVIQFDGADCHYLGHMVLHHAGHHVDRAPSRVRRIGSIVTACFLFDRSRWGDDLPFDEAFHFNYEDHDFGVRARARGFDLLSVPRAHGLHGTGTAGLSVRGDDEPSRARVVCLIRNRWWILFKVYALRTLLLLGPMLLVYEAFQLVGCVRRGWLGAWWQSVSDTIDRAGALGRLRREIQRDRRVGDGALFVGGRLPLRPVTARSPSEKAALDLLDELSLRWWALVRSVL